MTGVEDMLLGVMALAGELSATAWGTRPAGGRDRGCERRGWAGGPVTLAGGAALGGRWLIRGSRTRRVDPAAGSAVSAATAVRPRDAVPALAAGPVPALAAGPVAT